MALVLPRLVIKPDIGEAPGPIPLYFNPSEYTIQHEIDLTPKTVPGLEAGLGFRGNRSVTLSLQLRFDTYELLIDVRNFTQKIARLADRVENSNRLPVCTISWGRGLTDGSVGLPFVGVVTSLTQKFTMFLANGTPVRATLDVSFRRAISAEDQKKEKPLKKDSPLQARQRVVQLGDSLWSIATAEYGAADKWRPIAEANNLTNPRVLEPGRELVIPSVE